MIFGRPGSPEGCSQKFLDALVMGASQIMAVQEFKDSNASPSGDALGVTV
jgi:hypothetical protein